MSLRVLDTAERGIRRAASRNGLVLMGVLFIVGLASALLDAGIARLVALDPADPTSVGVAVPALGAGLLSFALGVLSLVVVIAAIRVFVTDETERLPREAFTRRMGWAWLNAFVGAIVFAIVVALGFVAFVVPGFFLLAALALWTVFVAVEDENFVAAMRSSWGLTRGSRLSLFGLGVVVFAVTIGVSIVFGAVGALAAPLGLVLGAAASAVTTILSVAVLATAYTTLVADREEAPEMPSDDAVTGTGTTGGI